MFGIGLRRKKALELPGNWREICDRGSAAWRLLDDDERIRAGDYAAHLLATKNWEPARGFEFGDEPRTIVSIHAALLILGLDPSHYDTVKTIIVRASSYRRSHQAGRIAGTVETRPGAIDGEAEHGWGSVMVAWDAARREARNPRLGRDVVIHEFAHKLDMRDGVVNGTPLLDEPTRGRWVEVCTSVFDEVREGDWQSILRPYAGTDPGEFFAVAAEAFLTKPVELLAALPELYELMAGYLHQDPAGRVERAAEAARAAEAEAISAATRSAGHGPT